MNQNITGLLGNTDTNLTCAFFIEKGEKIISVQIIVKNITEDFGDKNPIAIFKPEEAAKVHTSGNYLLGRVTLTNITATSTNASMTFNELKCIDEKDYMCQLYYNDMEGATLTEKSQTTRILVKVDVRDLTITKQPNKTQYDRNTAQIKLTCKGNGNPEPTYKWFREENTRIILAWGNIYIIEDVKQNNSGMYICEAYNTIDGIMYNTNYSVDIAIGESVILFVKLYGSVEVLEGKKHSIALLFVNVSY
ncbi:unnamed protein product [Mytilus coruscus]|uniref:Ig-like domain-containing protein n=1 Tax=Mytilus coruscus TaxID=42192 RepID=A0A6J8BQL7_MYTCO|nr:unnamed protein product [Mytilus coruscus]